MAGDWIKMRIDLQTHPKVFRIVSALKADRFRIAGAAGIPAQVEQGQLPVRVLDHGAAQLCGAGLAGACGQAGCLAARMAGLVIAPSVPGFLVFLQVPR